MINRANQRKRLLKRFSDINIPSIVFMKGAKNSVLYNTDRDIKFRQESNFWFLTGLNEPNCAMALNLQTSEFVLFMEEFMDDHEVWSGPPIPFETLKEKLGATDVAYHKDIQKFLMKWKPELIFTLSKNEFEFEKVDSTRLYEELRYVRQRKTEDEIEIMKKVNKISSDAHIKMMKYIKPNIYEYQLRGIFEGYCYENGCETMAYECIVGSGIKGAILHCSDIKSELKDGQLVLMDCGGELLGYASDITRTVPVNGKFSQKQSEIYSIVLDAQKAVIEKMKSGVQWVEMHLLAEKIICEGLIKLGLIKGSYDELIQNDIIALFFPHGLGHFLGLDIHDPPNRDSSVINVPKRKGIQYLRCNPVLEEGMILTVEPGIYFIKPLLEQAFKNPSQTKYLDIEKIKTYLDFGGIRIEDNILITKDGILNLTTTPKEIKDIEEIMKK